MSLRLFSPILAGATLRERALACLGALVGIALTGALCGLAFGPGLAAALIVAPVGASAVLLFSVPASPLAQPWPIVGGNTISALVGLGVAQFVPVPALAIGLAVALAIAAMSLTRSLHPPGGAAALTAVVGGPLVEAAGIWFPLVPVAINSLLLVLFGLAFHRLAGRAYPHLPPPAPGHGTADPPAAERTGIQPADIDAALAALDETFDIGRADLERLFRQVEYQALARSTATLTCADIMSRDVVRVTEETSAQEARALLVGHAIRTLPVVDGEGLLVGTVGLRELLEAAGRVGPVVTPARTAAAADPAMGLLPVLTDGRSHAVVVAEGRRILGLITQTDLLAATASLVSAGVGARRP